MFDRILFPTDGREGSLSRANQDTPRSGDGGDGRAEALEYALGLAEAHGAVLHVLFVADTQRDSVTLVGTDVVDALTQVGEGAVAGIASRAEERGITAVTDVEQGTPWRTILDYTDREGIDLVVMATHGRGGLERYLLGSVTEKVVRAADVPVMTVRIHDDG